MTATNEVRLVGQLVSAPEERELRNGATTVALRLRVPRGAGSGYVDTIECAVQGRLRHHAAAWKKGDQVEVTGAIRQRIDRCGTSRPMIIRFEVELANGRLVKRAA